MLDLLRSVLGNYTEKKVFFPYFFTIKKQGATGPRWAVPQLGGIVLGANKMTWALVRPPRTKMFWGPKYETFQDEWRRNISHVL